MHEQATQVLKSIKRVVLKLFFLLFAMYGLFFVLIYTKYNNNTKAKKQQTIECYYNKIVAITLSELNRLAAKQSINLQASDRVIEMDPGCIKIYQKNNCLDLNLFKFAALISKFIPEFINYKIELNKKNIYGNTRMQDYEVEKTYAISKYIQLTIALSIDPLYWQNEVFNIKQPFYILSLALIISLLLFYLLFRLILKYSNKLYQSYYNNYYQAILAQLNMEHQQQLKYNETLLMEKIWNMDFNRQRDVAINYLFAHAANQIAYGNQDKLNNLIEQAPCSIILYQPGCQEKIDTHKLINVFTDRFSVEVANIHVNLSSSSSILYFSSQAALYQIVYSIISYLLFLLKQLPNTDQYQVNVSIAMIEQRLQLSFIYNGRPVNSEEELFSKFDIYFKTHANPFLLNINQVFSTLKSSGFNCIVNSNELNRIEITEKALDYGSTKNNFISITSKPKQ